MSATFHVDLQGPTEPLPHFWEHTVGSGHATLALRADWQAQLRRAHDELGMKHVRFHGILDDDMGTLICQSDELLYSFFNADQIIDFLLSIGMRPFVELSFMPTALASGDKTAFHYKGNVSAPKDLDAWGTLISGLVGHWVDRYGIDEVRQWFFEVWNEPNLDAFGDADQAKYFELYRHTSKVIKAIDGELRVGGPTTAANAWIDAFVAFCEANDVAADFVSTHHYPTDAFGKPGDDTEAQLAASPRSALRDQAAEVKSKAGGRPVYYTEWCTSSNPRDPLHDEPWAAAFIVKTVLEARGLVEGYSYWTFSDIFEENYFPSVPFHGGFGMQNIHGIAKPAYRAFQLLHGLGTTLHPVEGTHPTVDAWVVSRDGGLDVVLTNMAHPRHAITVERVAFAMSHALVTSATVRRIDAQNANAKGRWQALGRPEYLSARDLHALHEASEWTVEPLAISVTAERHAFAIELPAQSVAVVSLRS